MSAAEDLIGRDREKLNKLVEQTRDLEFDKGSLLRFLKARNYDVKKAEEMARASVTWHEEIQKSYFGNSFEFWKPPPEVSEGFDIYYCGRDAENRLVFYAPLGMWASARDLFEKGLEDDCLRYAGKSMDHVEKLLLATKHQNFVCIVDNTGVSWSKAWYEAQNYQGINDLIRLFREYEQNYPETLHKAYVINTPTVFYWGFNIVKPLMSKCTLEKIKFFTEDESQWLPALHNNLPLEAIPPQFGGTSSMKPLWPLENFTEEIDLIS